VKFLCLINLDEREMDDMPIARMNELNAGHLALNEALRSSGHLIEADALAPSSSGVRLRLRAGKTTVTDGPFTEAKEVVAGYYLIEARDMAEAIAIASRFPSAPIGTVEVRPCRELYTEPDLTWRGERVPGRR
jgi:hypothetical protein